MAYISQERKSQIAPVVREICKKYDIKGSLSINNHRTLVLTIKQGPIDFISNFNQVCGAKHVNRFTPATDHISVNPYWFQDHFSGRSLQFLKEVYDAMMKGNHDNSDIQSDYFDVGWYVDINIGRWDRPYALVK